MSSDLATAMIDRARRAVAEQPDTAGPWFALAEVLWRAGDEDGFADAFRQGYLRRPAMSGALQDGEPEDRRARAHALLRRGVRFSRVIASLAIAEARLGNGAELRRLFDYDRFFISCTAEPPAGQRLEDFHGALRAAILSDLRHYGTAPRAIHSGSRADRLFTQPSKIRDQLLSVLQPHIARYIAALPDDDSHPFVAARPHDYRINGWAVVSGDGTYHDPHIHGRAWLTGVYYVVQPEISRREPPAGWLRVGPPPFAGASAELGWQTRLVEPVPGTIVLMPGYFFHGTAPMGVDQERICIAFEVEPAEIASPDAARP